MLGSFPSFRKGGCKKTSIRGFLASNIFNTGNLCCFSAHCSILRGLKEHCTSVAFELVAGFLTSLTLLFLECKWLNMHSNSHTCAAMHFRFELSTWTHILKTYTCLDVVDQPSVYFFIRCSVSISLRKCSESYFFTQQYKCLSLLAQKFIFEVCEDYLHFWRNVASLLQSAV